MKKQKKEKLSEFSDDDLLEEIDRRKEEKRPKQLENPDLNRLRNTCDEHMFLLAEERKTSREIERHTYEVTMITLYGPDIFDWINEQID